MKRHAILWRDLVDWHKAHAALHDPSELFLRSILAKGDDRKRMIGELTSWYKSIGTYAEPEEIREGLTMLEAFCRAADPAGYSEMDEPNLLKLRSWLQWYQPHVRNHHERGYSETDASRYLANQIEAVTAALSTKEPPKELPAPPSAPAEEATGIDTKPAEKHIFRRVGDVWQIVFEGYKLDPVRHLHGMTYLAAMLAQPRHDFPALDLYRLENPPPPEAMTPPKGNTLNAEDRKHYGTGGGHECVLDQTAKQALNKRKMELQTELNDKDLSKDDRDNNEQELERIDAALANCRVAKSTGGATFERKEVTAPRNAVCNAIDRALTAISEKKNGGGNVAKHLASTRNGGAVNTGNTLSYVGSNTWVT